MDDNSADMTWLTTAHVIFIIAFAIAAILILVWGSRLRARRRAADRELEQRGELRHIGDPVPPAPAPAPRAAAPIERVAPPVTPALPPLAPTAAATPASEPKPGAVSPAPAPAPVPPAPAPVPTATTEPAAATAPAPGGAGDELTRLKGVGPKLAAKLNELGITRFAQIAALTPDDAAALDAQLGNFRGRLGRDRWIDQARYLAADDRAGFEAEFGKL